MVIYAYTARPRKTPESRRDTAYSVAPNLGDRDGSLPSRWYNGNQKDINDRTSLHEFLASGLDWLVLCVPGTSAAHHLVGATELDILSKSSPDGVMISNVGRGSVLDSDALLRALQQGQIRGACLDVTDPEPLPADHGLWKRKDVIITPHVSAYSRTIPKRGVDVLRINMERLERDEELMNRVDVDRGY
jgi:phosphoglycerate dehydrogenase-like enzyme